MIIEIISAFMMLGLGILIGINIGYYEKIKEQTQLNHRRLKWPTKK